MMPTPDYDRNEAIRKALGLPAPYTAETWPHLEMLDQGWIVVGWTAVRVEVVGQRIRSSSPGEHHHPSVRVYQSGRSQYAALTGHHLWAVAFLPYTDMVTRTLGGFATEADAQVIADRILHRSGAWDAPPKGEPDARGDIERHEAQEMGRRL